MKTFIRFFVERTTFANLFTILVIALGVLAAMNARREAFPQVDFDIVMVSTPWPGASPAEVERLVTTPMEQEIDSVDGIDEMGSVSVENLSLVILKLDPDSNATKKRETIDEIEDAVARVKNLPDTLEPTTIEEIKSDRTPVIEVNLSGPNEHELRRHADFLEDRFLDIDGVASIEKRGWRDREVLVEVKPKNLEAYYLSLVDVGRAVRNRNLNLPGGKVKLKGDEWLCPCGG